MNKKLQALLKELANKLKPLKKEIFSVTIHGSSIYSEELKKHQDIDTFIIFKRMSFSVLKKFRRLLKDFCKEQSNLHNGVYYSIAGSGRTSIEKMEMNKEQIYRLEVFVSFEDNFKVDFRENKSFPRAIYNNSMNIIGENIKKWVKYSGDTENPLMTFNEFDKVQWMYCSILEEGYKEDIVLNSCQESVFNLLRTLLQVSGVNELRKDRVFQEFIKLFPKDSRKFKQVIEETARLRAGKRPEGSIINYLKSVQELNLFMRGKTNEKILRTSK